MIGNTVTQLMPGVIAKKLLFGSEKLKRLLRVFAWSDSPDTDDRQATIQADLCPLSGFADIMTMH